MRRYGLHGGRNVVVGDSDGTGLDSQGRTVVAFFKTWLEVDLVSCPSLL